MADLSNLIDVLDVAAKNHDAVYRAAFASGVAYASFSDECRQANERIGRALSALSFEVVRLGWRPCKPGDEHASYYVRSAAMRMLERA